MSEYSFAQILTSLPFVEGEGGRVETRLSTCFNADIV